MKRHPLFLLSILLPVTLATSSLAQRPEGPPRRGSDAMDEPLFPSQTVAKSERERRVLSVLQDMDENQRRGSMSVPVNDGRLLRILAESMEARHVVELGTSIGYSGLWFCLALESTGGRLTTFEIDEERAAQARANFERAGMADRVTLLLGDAHERVAEVEGPVDIVFLDADKQGYLDYLEKLLPKLKPGGLVIAHNMNRRQADPRYVEAVTTNPEIETVFISAGGSGLGISMKKR